jgi:putative ATP-binding cassette transporter
MRLFDFLRKESSESWTPLIALTVVSGIANGAILALINAGASAAASDTVSFRVMAMFIIAITVFMLAKNRSLNQTMVIVEAMVRTLRVRICDKLRRSELPFVESLGKGELYTTIGQDANLISHTTFIVINAAQEAIMLVFALLYVAWLSTLGFVIVLIAIAVGMTFYYFHRRSLTADLRQLANTDAQFLDTLGHIVDGFKEAKLNRRKNDALFATFTEIAGQTETLKVGMGIKFVTDIMFAHVFFYALIGAIVFLLPRIVPTFSEVVLKMTAAVLFIIGPLEMIVNAMPLFARSSVALDNLYRLEGRLDTEMVNHVETDVERFNDFREISLESAVFNYADGAKANHFAIGPLDLSIHRGEMLFIVGGNGSGKSTLLKVLTGLYPLTSGLFRIDNVPLDAHNVAAYRELISAIFTDFHLFDRLYGLEGVSESRVAELLKEMELTGKTAYVNGRFTDVQLSTGQRKRLALIAALLEDRPIIVFDEWAADQDAHFREYFYRVILKRLNDEGKTVIAVTHDDRYWDVADRVVKMEMGRITGAAS